MKIGESIKYWRELRGISQAKLARDIGMSKGNLSGIESDKIENPGALAVYRISLALNVRMEQLVAGSVPLCSDSITLKGEKFGCELGKGHRDWHSWYGSSDTHTPVNLYWVNDELTTTKPYTVSEN